jgi:hypothetical protein
MTSRIRVRLAVVVSVAATVSSAPLARAGDPTAGIAIDVRKLKAGERGADPAATRVAPRRPRMPAVLAASTEPARRAATTKLYTQLLERFDEVADKLHVPRRDVAVAAAMYVGSAYAVYRGTQLSDAAFLALVKQLRGALAATPAFTRAPLSQKQDMYEGLAIVGLLLAVSAQSGDDSMRDMAKTSLEAFLPGGIDAIEIDDRGLRVASAAAGREPAPEPEAAAEPEAAPAARGGRAAPAPAVTGILWSFEMDYDPLSSSMVNRESTYLLFPNGTCTDEVPALLDGFDPAARRAADPKSWGRWRKRGDSYEISFGGEKYSSPPKQTVLRGARRGERLAGSWTRSRTSSVGSSSTWQSNTLVLKANGRFERARAGAFTSNSDLNRPDGEVVVSGAYDDDGSIANISGKEAGGSVRSRGGRTEADRTGTYVLDGFSIELRYASGAVERHLFAISSDPGHVFVRLGNTIMTSGK